MYIQVNRGERQLQAKLSHKKESTAYFRLRPEPRVSRFMYATLYTQNDMIFNVHILQRASQSPAQRF